MFEVPLLFCQKACKCKLGGGGQSAANGSYLSNFRYYDFSAFWSTCFTSDFEVSSVPSHRPYRARGPAGLTGAVLKAVAEHCSRLRAEVLGEAQVGFTGAASHR